MPLFIQRFNMEMSNTSVLLVVALALLCVFQSRLTDSCQLPIGYVPPSDEEYVFKSDNFIYGTVRRTFGYENPPYAWYDSLYIAEVVVHCIYKGIRTPATVNITQVGYIPGFCFSTELEAGRSYAILTNFHDNEFFAQQTIAADEQKVKLLATVCGLYTQYPHGVDSSSASFQCPPAAPSEVCLDQDYFDSTRPKPQKAARRTSDVLRRLLKNKADY